MTQQEQNNTEQNNIFTKQYTRTEVVDKMDEMISSLTTIKNKIKTGDNPSKSDWNSVAEPLGDIMYTVLNNNYLDEQMPAFPDGSSIQELQNRFLKSDSETQQKVMLQIYPDMFAGDSSFDYSEDRGFYMVEFLKKIRKDNKYNDLYILLNS